MFINQLSQQMALAHRHQRCWLSGLAIFCLLMLVLSLCAGDRWLLPDSWLNHENQLFIWQLSLPRSLAVLFVGASLAVIGAVMQALFENPLAEPGLLGVANGAGVGLVLSIFAGVSGLWQLSFFAIASALLVTFIILRFSCRSLSNSRLLLAGVVLGIIGSAVMTWAVYFSPSLDIRQLMYWMMGGFSGVDWRYGGLMLALMPY